MDKIVHIFQHLLVVGLQNRDCEFQVFEFVGGGGALLAVVGNWGSGQIVQVNTIVFDYSDCGTGVAWFLRLEFWICWVARCFFLTQKEVFIFKRDSIILLILAGKSCPKTLIATVFTFLASYIA